MKTTLALFLMAHSIYAQRETDFADRSRDQARSVVMTRYGIVATSQTLASAAGAKILEQGGSAVDAAIAANALIGLLEPTGNGMGGDLFAIVYEAKTGRLHGLNASGWSPSGLTAEFLESKNRYTMPGTGIYSVTVPGAVAGWDALHRKFGVLPWAGLFRPAIHYAREGFPVTELISEAWRVPSAPLSKPDARKLYLPDGKAPVPGTIFRNPDLAKSLQQVALGGRDAFYTGPIAKAILKASKDEEGTFIPSDLSEYQPEWVQPVSVDYRGWTVTELPPNGQGIAALSMLNIMERFPLGSYGHNSADALHIAIEAKKLAYADLLQYVGDPRFSQVPVEQLLSKQLAEQRTKLLDPAKASCKQVPAELQSIAKQPGADTIYLSVIDKAGNIVSLIQSNYEGFGSGVVPPGTGFMLQNRGALFTVDRNKPNSLAPRKRPLHTIIPGFLSKGQVRIGFGIMGGWNQAQAHAQFVSNVVDFDMNIQAAMEAARFTKTTFDTCGVSMESRVPERVRDELTRRGHEINLYGAFSSSVGGGQAVMHDSNGVHHGASDPRKDGAAVPQNPRPLR